LIQVHESYRKLLLRSFGGALLFILQTFQFFDWLSVVTKGQLISKCPFGVKTSSKKPTKFFPGFLP